MSKFSDEYLSEISWITTGINTNILDEIVDVVERAYNEGRKVLIIGNGGSAATASHLAVDLQKGVSERISRPFRAISLTDNTPMITALANDISYTHIFSFQLETMASAGDVLIAFSGSGNSTNITKACQTARSMGLTSIGITGFEGGKLINYVDYCLVVPSSDLQQVEDFHMIISHMIYRDILRREKDRGVHIEET